MNTKERKIVRSRKEDLPVVMDLLSSGRAIMRDNGNFDQWPEGRPARETVEKDIERRNSYLVMEEGEPVATFAFVEGPDPTYSMIEGGVWLSDRPYHVIHRMAKKPSAKGIFRYILDYCFSRCGNIRIDTHEDNSIMRHCIQEYGFAFCGTIYIDDGTPRLAYQMSREDVPDDQA